MEIILLPSNYQQWWFPELIDAGEVLLDARQLLVGR